MKASASELGEGPLEGHAIRMALPSGGSPFHSIAISEAFDVAEMLAAESDLPRQLLLVGIVLDLMCTEGSSRCTTDSPMGKSFARVVRSRVVRRYKLDLQTVKALEIVWELVDPLVRFDLARSAVRVIMARRMGGSS